MNSVKKTGYALLLATLLASPTVQAEGIATRANAQLQSAVRWFDGLFRGDTVAEQRSLPPAQALLQLGGGYEYGEFASDTFKSSGFRVSLPATSHAVRGFVETHVDDLNPLPSSPENGPLQTVDWGVNMGVSGGIADPALYGEVERRTHWPAGMALFDARGFVGYDTKREEYAGYQLIASSDEPDAYAPRATTELAWQHEGDVELTTSMSFFRAGDGGTWEDYAWTHDMVLSDDPRISGTALRHTRQIALGDEGWFTRLGGGVRFEEGNDFAAEPFVRVELRLHLGEIDASKGWDEIDGPVP